MNYSTNENCPLVCVMMPVYNGAKTIKLALASLINQTYTNWTCIIVNDGSTDETASIIASLSDSRFHIIHLEKNKGRGFARQTALENACGEYLTFLDADDFFHIDKLKYQVEFLNKNTEVDLIGTATITFNTSFVPTSYRNYAHPHPITYHTGNPLHLSMGTSMMRLGKISGITYNPKLNASEDVDFFSRYLHNRIYMSVPDIYYYYYVSEDTTTYSKMLEYAVNGIKRGMHVCKSTPFPGIKIISKSILKWFIYALTIPLFGVDFFLNKRGLPVSAEERTRYDEQLNLITKGP